MNTDDLYSATPLDSQLEPQNDSQYDPAVYPSDTPGYSAQADRQMMDEDEESVAGSEDSADLEDLVADIDDYSILMRSWINERGAPEILEYQGTAIENLMELADFQQQKLSSKQTTGLVANIISMELERVKYLVRSYLRTRLAKIEDHAKYYLQEPMYRERLSQAELDYAKGFVDLENRHVKASFLDQLPPHLRALDDVSAEGLDMVPKPDLDSAVFCRVRVNVGEFQFVSSEDPIVMRRNNIFITRYSTVRDLVADSKVELI
ncbi:GINS complex subunit [Coemansia sp. Benny D115]|nr:GINS complex subunit [Coemansia sp. Benny D115]